MEACQRVYVGNLSTMVNNEELTNLFGLEATPYLKQSCWVELARKQNGESRGFAFANVPEHIAQELLKFNGIDFYGRPLQIEPAKVPTNAEEGKDKEKNSEVKKDGDGKQTKKNKKQRGRGGARGSMRGGAQGGAQFRRGGGFQSNLPALGADQMYHMMDGGVNLINGNMFNMNRLSRGRGLFDRGSGRGMQFRRGAGNMRPPFFDLQSGVSDQADNSTFFNIQSSRVPGQVYGMIDGGCNLVHGKFAHNTDAVLSRARASGVEKIVVTGNRLNGSRSAVVMAQASPNLIYAAVGIHPHHVKDDWNESAMSALKDLVKMPEVVAIGEVGLDFNRNFTPKEAQQSAFEKQVELACHVQKPLLIHDRDAHTTIIEVLEKYKSQLPTIVMHCFTGGVEQVNAYLARGYYIGVTGYICKVKYGKPLRDMIQEGVLPIDKICIQTNAPYMIPNMAKTDMDQVSQKLLTYCNEGCNEPCTLSVIVKCIAKLVGKEPKDVAKILTETTRNIFDFNQ